MKRKLKNKLLLVFMITFICLLFLTNTSNANANNSFVDENYKTVYYTLPAGYQSYTLFKDGNGYVLLYTDVKDVYWSWDNKSGYDKICCYTDKTCNTVANFYRTQKTSSDWNYSPVEQEDGSYLLDFANANFMKFTSFSNVTKFITADTNVYYKGTEDIFFQVAPPTLTQILQAEVERKTIPMEIVGIIPQTLVVMVCFLGLRKALKMLSTVLRKA